MQVERKNIMIGKTSSKSDGNDLTRHIKQKSKANKEEIHETVEHLEISAPFSVQHKVKAKFDADNLRFSGIPSEWKDIAHKQFGVPLAQCPRVELDGYSDRIPIVLIKLRLRLEELGGLETEGIFRLAPSGAESSDVKSGLNSGLVLQSLEKTDDPHIASNLIKQFFRELPPNLLNPLSRDQILEISEMKEEEKLDEAFKLIPEPNYSSFLWLLDLLLDVASHSSVNKMTEMNLAIVISPNLYFGGGSVAPMEALVLSQKVAQLMTTALRWRKGKHASSS